MAYGIWIATIILGIVAPKSKLIYRFQLALLFVVFAFNTWTPDYDNYRIAYDNIRLGNVYFVNYEIGYSLLMLFSKSLGLSYSFFRVAISILYILILNQIIDKESSNKAHVMSWCMIFPLLAFVSGVRASLSSLLIINSLRFLITNKKKAFVMLIIACLFHYSSIVFLLLFIQIDLNNLQPSRILRSKYFYLIIGLIVVLYFAFVRSTIGYQIIARITNRQKTLIWLSTASDRPNSMGVFVSSIIVLITSVLTLRITARNKSSLDEKIDVPVILSTRMVALFNLILIPFLMLNNTFMRLFYSTLPFCYLGISNSLLRPVCRSGNNEIIRGKYMINEILFLLWIIILALYYDYNYFRGTDYSTFQVLVDNYILGFLSIC